MSATASLNSRDNRRNGIAQEVEFRLREIVEEALRYNRKSKASALTVRSVEQAVLLKTGEPLFGVRAEDQLQYERSETRPDGFFTRDPLVPVRGVISSVLPQPPAEVTFMSHWLAIDGIQPRIMENTPVPDTVRAATSQAAGKRPHPGASLALPQQPQTKGLKPPPGGKASYPDSLVLPLSHDLPGEAQLYVDRLGRALDTFAEGAATEAAQYASSLADLDAYASSLARDAGLQQMLPTVAALLADKYKEHMRSVPVCLTLLRLLASLVDNPFLQVDRYLHTVIAIVQGILCNRSLGILKVPLTSDKGQQGGEEGGDPMALGFAMGGDGSGALADNGKTGASNKASERTRDLSCLEHVVARERAALLLQTILAKYGDSTPSLRPRVLKAIADQVCLASTPLATLTGAITGVRLCGGDPAVRAVLLDPFLTQRLSRELGDPSVLDRPFDYHCLLYCLHALSQAVQALPEMRHKQQAAPEPAEAGSSGTGKSKPRAGLRPQSFLVFNKPGTKGGAAASKKKGASKAAKPAPAAAASNGKGSAAAAKKGHLNKPSLVSDYFTVDEAPAEKAQRGAGSKKEADGVKFGAAVHFEPCSERGRFRSFLSSELPFKIPDGISKDEQQRLVALHDISQLASEMRMMLE